ncbi:phosphate ABC transporter substrate-binding protein PstS [Ruicaihuangia caeni]|uniref:Phosphate-binding protein n=1 Tax=Ruicaihuangia caeni TaxID=3042517 RepID=A0AAW6T8R1_9MICO|nr:phosphate ABC transporter substrate-binding protein PstS [Klugiella sp. YN-L-19]MDI2098719.1 phosphate ABC transporter substrate-binding protein PstS [Klugiella sp. YN-L-19]
MRRALLVTTAMILVLPLGGCAVNELGLEGKGKYHGTLVGSGASSQQAAQEAWIAGFQSANADATIEYDPSGSGAGRDSFIAGGSMFAGSDRALHIDEIESSHFAACAEGSGIVEVPAYISPIAVVFTLEGIDRLDLDPTTIARIFSGEITRWNAEPIAASNPGVELPDLAITPVHRADDSGVTENFTEYLSVAAADSWPYEPDGVWPITNGEAAPQTSGMVAAVRNGVGTIGYVDASRARGLDAVAVKVGDEFVPYSAEAAAAVVDVSTVEPGRGPADLAFDLDRTPSASGVYPIVLISYLIACQEYREPAIGELARGFFEYVISEEAQRAAQEHAGSAPMSASLQQRAAEAVATIH